MLFRVCGERIFKKLKSKWVSRIYFTKCKIIQYVVSSTWRYLITNTKNFVQFFIQIIEDFLEIRLWAKILKIFISNTIKKFRLIFKKYNVKPLVTRKKKS